MTILVLPANWNNSATSSLDPFAAIMAQQGTVYRDVKKRKTLQFEHNGQRYFVKLHWGVGWAEIIKNLLLGRLPVLGAKQEWLAIQALDALGVPTLKLVGYGCKGHNPAHLQSFVITKALENTISLEDLCSDWPQHPPLFNFKRALIAKVASIARQLHIHGINHRDFYICHFLLKKNIINNASTPNTENTTQKISDALYLIDLHRVQVRKSKRTPSRWIVKDIAGLYFSSLDIGLTQRDYLFFCKHYFNENLSNLAKKHASFLEKVKRRAIALYAKTFFEKKRSWNRLLLWDKRFDSAQLKQLLINPDVALEQNFLKQDTTTTLSTVTIDGQKFVIKRYNIKGFWHGVKRGFQTTRAMRCWQHAHQLLRLGIKTARPVAVIEKRYGPWHSTSYFITEFITAPHAGDFFNTIDIDSQCATMVASRLMTVLSRLKKACLSHGDMKATNILIKDNEPVLIDLDSMQQHYFKFRQVRATQRDTNRFMKNWNSLPQIRNLFSRLTTRPR